MTPHDTNGWGKAEKYVFEELTRLSEKMDSIDDKLNDLRVVVATKGALWGALSATVISIVGFLLKR